jgi:drug/metabolite transporter (DMT)-like permease
MKRVEKIGFIDAIISSVGYGLYPMFGLLLYNTGSSIANSLFYRYFFAFLIYFYILKFYKKMNLSVTIKEFMLLFLVGIVFAASSISVFIALKYIDSGIACTIVFLYPVFVALIMSIFFNEKLTKATVISIICAFIGVVFLNYAEDMNSGGKALGFILSFLGAIMYGLYIILVKTIKDIKRIHPSKVTFYVLLSGTIFYFICLRFGLDFQLLTTPKQWLYALSLATICTIVAIETVNVAIKFIGATRTSVIGALEPLTAMVAGFIVFGEQMSIFDILGFLLVTAGIFLVVKKK